MIRDLQQAAVRCTVLSVLWLLLGVKNVAMFIVSVRNDNSFIISLEPSDVSNSSSVYIVKVTGESKNYFFQFDEFNGTLPAPIVFNASYHGLYYMITLMAANPKVVSRPAKTVTVLTKPLPVTKVSVSDYIASPETGVVFEIQYPEKYNVFSKVNISYYEGKEYRSMLYKDLFKGKTIFNHWLSGTCYSNITFQLVSEATVNKSTVVAYSGVGHELKQHRTVPYSPSNISMEIRQTNQTNSIVDVSQQPQLLPQNSMGTDSVTRLPFSSHGEDLNFVASQNWESYNSNSSEYETMHLPSWTSAEVTVNQEDEGFINKLDDQFEDLSGSSMPFELPALPQTALPVQLYLRWLPPKPPTAYDGFYIYIQKEGNTTHLVEVDEDTHTFTIQLHEPGKYKVLVKTFSSSGPCESRESFAENIFSFYLSPSGQVSKELTEQAKNVVVTLLNSTVASVSWTSSLSNDRNAIVSIVSLTCRKPRENQRLEMYYCTEVNSSSNIIGNLIPGAQYRAVVYLRNGPYIGPPSTAVTFGLDPTGIRDLMLIPLGPMSVILSWNRPYYVAFKKYVVEMFYFNPTTQTSEWSTYYEIAATVSLTASVVINLHPAWYYNFRVTMVSWGDPERSCCDSSTISFITAPTRPEITSVEHFHGMLYISWSYSSDITDLSHSRMLHWLVIAEGKKRIKKSVTRNVMTAVLSLPPGDRYNLTVTACTERSSNKSAVYFVELEPAPPKSLFAVNKTQTSVTLLWVEEGIADSYEVNCGPIGSMQEKKVPVSIASHAVTISNLLPATLYNCSVTTVSHNIRSIPAFIAVSTVVAEINPNMVVIIVLAILSILLIGLLLITLIVLKRKRLQMARDCGAGTFVNFASLERDGKLPYNWRRSIFAFLTLLPSCVWTDYLLAFYINPWNKNGLKKRKLTNPVQMDDFDAYMKDMARDTDYKFSLQFEELKLVGLDIPHNDAELPSNRCKNRYTNILPYDFSRVRLISMHEDEGSDYINANYIPGYNSRQEYIATQGPLPETRYDFWKMVLQQKSPIIVMLTQCNERRRVKCDHYWPFTDEPMRYGDIVVEMVTEDEKAEWAVRQFRVHYEDEMQCILHFNYTAWPDHSVPTASTAESILQFVSMVRKHATKKKGPIIVHCSAGVGRTGTFIALDRLQQHLKDHEFVDILGLVAELRSYRMCMVQTEEQYIFIHRCVQLMWAKKKQKFNISDVIYENTIKS
ncbi:receptor-type tyrosine-protein phosphatase O isoform X2 [Protopterus annectens]|uniref:receptor-type tyrosine-protein phosphatase O isoform X2 n=1 Tax=Protopterus annectens TaxID=7888 RepID=UPI001CFC2A7B|nr:receptor-type tyrosine-protein phosphatase O isoform X2 [Protopterus annectens]